MKARMIIATVALLATAPSAVMAGPTFNVNRTIGAGSVTGTIDTDGRIGTLGAGNILAWNLVIDDGPGLPFTLVGGGSSANSQLSVGGSLLSATLTDIRFDFAAPLANGYTLFQNPVIGSGQNWWCLDTATNCARTGSNTESVMLATTSPTAVGRQGQVSIGTLQGLQVPEPVTLLLLGLGFAGIGLSRHRKGIS